MRPSYRTSRKPLEGATEVLVPDGVDGRVQQAVAVAEPQHDAHHIRRHLTSCAEGQNSRQDEEGQPAEDEAADDQAEGPRRAANAPAVAALGVRTRHPAFRQLWRSLRGVGIRLGRPRVTRWLPIGF